MIFRHKDGSDSASSISFGIRDKADIDDNGHFEVDGERTELIEKLVELGHEPIEPQGGSEATEQTESETDPLEGITDDDIVAMSYDEKRDLSKSFDDIDGRWSDAKLEDHLLQKVYGS